MTGPRAPSQCYQVPHVFRNSVDGPVGFGSSPAQIETLTTLERIDGDSDRVHAKLWMHVHARQVDSQTDISEGLTMVPCSCEPIGTSRPWRY